MTLTSKVTSNILPMYLDKNKNKYNVCCLFHFDSRVILLDLNEYGMRAKNYVSASSSQVRVSHETYSAENIKVQATRVYLFSIIRFQC